LKNAKGLRQLVGTMGIRTRSYAGLVVGASKTNGMLLMGHGFGFFIRVAM